MDFQEPVNHPAHYNKGKIEVIDAIEDWGLNFNLGNVVKYVARADHKGNRMDDLKKARFYIDKEIAKNLDYKEPVKHADLIQELNKAKNNLCSPNELLLYSVVRKIIKRLP